MRKPITGAKWRSSQSARRSALENVLDTADIVRDGDLPTPVLQYQRSRPFCRDISILAKTSRILKPKHDARSNSHAVGLKKNRGTWRACIEPIHLDCAHRELASNLHIDATSCEHREGTV